MTNPENVLMLSAILFAIGGMVHFVYVDGQIG